MIRINSEWGIAVDENNYSPVRLGVSKKGEDTSRRIGYYVTLQGAIGRVAEEMSREELMKTDMSLTEAVEVIKNCYSELAVALAVTKPGSIEVKVG